MRLYPVVAVVMWCCALGVGRAEGQSLPRLIKLEVDGRNVPVEVSAEGKPSAVTLPSGRVWLRFGPDARDKGSSAQRFRYRLEGVDEDWRERTDQMRLVVVFYDSQGDWVAETSFPLKGESPGWNGSACTSPLMAWREDLRVPERAASFSVMLTSAGPPEAVGTLAFGALKVWKSGTATTGTEPVLEMSFPSLDADFLASAVPSGWRRTGTRPTMAQIVASESVTGGRLLAVIDEDDKSHAEWQSPRTLIAGEAGGALQVEWKCCFSIGLSVVTVPVTYDRLQPGRYVFRMNEVSLVGQPASGEASQLLIVTPPFWQRAWFLVLCGMAVAALVFGAARYVDWRRTRREIAAMRQQQALDQERMRIARDLHDEIGANLTHISILGTIASREGVAVSEMRTKCLEVAEVARETIRACSEIVWSVNPLNDSLASVIRHLTHYAQEYLQSAGIASVIDTAQPDTEVRLNPKVRHELLMTFKEALQNVVKHSKAAEVRLAFVLNKDTFSVRIVDDGRGFSVAACTGSEGFHGNGIRNMNERISGIAGVLAIESCLEKGTTVCVTVPVK